MAVTVADWELAVERGPAWLMVRLTPPDDTVIQTGDLAQAVWSVLEQHFTYRVVLEMDQVQYLNSHLIGQLVRLHKRIHQHGGVLRLCGLNEACQQVLRISQLQSRLPNYANREVAILGTRPVFAK